jgi:MFS family permease
VTLPPAKPPSLGIRQNLPQFSLLILINAFVGAMVGMERSILPIIAEQEFGIASRTAILSFLVSFGVVKAVSNLIAGRSADLAGRKTLLMLGWIAGFPVPFMLMWAPSWSWIVAANILLGIQQGLCWSMTVIMKIDLAGSERRGFAMGLNEFAGYVAVALAAFASATVAANLGLRPYPFLIGIIAASAGLLLTLFAVRETRHHADHEASLANDASGPPRFREIFTLTSWRNATLAASCQAGFVNNLNDGAAWGLFPLFYASMGLTLPQTGILVALYPAVWGIAQLGTGALSDRIGRKWLIASGMVLQAFGFLLMTAGGFAIEAMAAAVIGLGTAMVYPTLLAAVADEAQPSWRATAVGVYRLWRDLGYAAGALVAGIVADLAGLSAAILFVGGLTLLSGIVAARLFRGR